MTVLTPPGYTQGGTYSAKLDRMYIGTVGYVPNLAASFSARQGFHSGRTVGVSLGAGMDVVLTACSAVIANTFASASGDYLMVNDAAVQVTLAASSPTQNRHDIIGFQVKDNIFDSSGLNTAVPAVIQGANSAGTPSDPALPASFLPVTRAVVNAGVTSPTLQSLARKTAANGGLVRIASVTERAEITPFEGYHIWREDRDWAEVYDGTAWRVQGVAVCSSTADRDSAITNPVTGQLAVTTDSNTVWIRRSDAVWVPAGARVMARGVRTSISSPATVTGTPVAVMRVAPVSVRAGRAVKMSATVHPRSTVAGDRVVVELRATTNGVAPTTASPVFAQAYFTAVTASAADTIYFEGTYEPASTESLWVLLTVTRGLGSGNVELYADATAVTRVEVHDEGPSVGNTGTNLP